MNVTYTTVGNVQIPDLVMNAQPEGNIGKYGRMSKRYLEEKHDGTFTVLVLSGKLTEHLLDIDRTAREQLEATIRQLATADGVTERLKATDQMEWLRRMNSIRARAEEIVIREVVYGE
ncbi:MAG: TnpV protein [Clostridia bacterium]|nr:TnpV protein [Clostridia bacterium]